MKPLRAYCNDNDIHNVNVIAAHNQWQKDTVMIELCKSMKKPVAYYWVTEMRLCSVSVFRQPDSYRLSYNWQLRQKTIDRRMKLCGAKSSWIKRKYRKSDSANPHRFDRQRWRKCSLVSYWKGAAAAHFWSRIENLWTVSAVEQNDKHQIYCAPSVPSDNIGEYWLLFGRLYACVRVRSSW